jgi:hypothetical protein
LSCEGSLYILDASLLSDTWFANIFFYYLACLFILLKRSFTRNSNGPVMVAYAGNQQGEEDEAGGSRVRGQPGLHLKKKKRNSNGQKKT